MSVDFSHLHQQLAELLGDHKIPPNDRCDALIYEIVDKGLDMRPTVRRLVEEAEVGRKLRDKLAAQEGHALIPERFIGTVDKPRLYAQVTRGPGVVWLPAAPEEIENLQPGDPVLIDTQTDRIVGRDGQLPITGDVVEVESLPANQPGRVYVKREGHSQLARLHHRLIADPDTCRPGTRMVYDALRNFVLEPAETATDGKELLLDLERVDAVRQQDVGAPKPVVDEILAHLKMFVEHPDWVKLMQARMRCSYLFIGGTGTGKSYTLRLIATEYGDFIEAVTGQRVSRVVMCDASQFWRSLFGETEQMIATWVQKLERLGGHTLRARNGDEIAAPLIVCVEECDALLRTRGDQTGSGHLFDRPLALFLQKIESLEAALKCPILWVATSNRPDLVDPASLRRIGMRTVFFGTLSVSEAAAVLAKKIPESLPIRARDGRGAGSRDALLGKVLGYVYGPSPKQGLAEVQFVNSERRTLQRMELLTPAILEEAVSAAIDQCLMESAEAGELLGIDGDDIVRFLHRHFTGLAHLLRPHNVAEHCPEWFAESSVAVANVVPLVSRNRRPVGLLVR
jgi:hypothetical protein